MTEATTTMKPVPRKNLRRARRQTPKRGTRVRVYANALGLGANIGVKVLDVSETGVRLLLKQALLPGSEFELDLESVGTRAVKLHADVVWCVESADGHFVIGASFQKPLSYLDLQIMAKV